MSVAEAEQLLTETFDLLEPDNERDSWFMIRITKIREALADRDPAHEQALHDEIDRLKEGDFTPAEFQNLCHNLEGKPGLTEEEFCRGCEEYQVKLFGRSLMRDRLTQCQTSLRHYQDASHLE